MFCGQLNEQGAAVTVTESVPLLFDRSGSAVSDSTLAEKEITVPLGVAGSTVTMRVNVAMSPDSMADVVQVTNPVPPMGGVVQLQPAGAISDLKVVWAGIVSARLTLPALSGPAFATVIEKVRSPP